MLLKFNFIIKYYLNSKNLINDFNYWVNYKFINFKTFNLILFFKLNTLNLYILIKEVNKKEPLFFYIIINKI